MRYKSILWRNKWIEVFKKDYFIGVKEPWCRNEGVAILPYVVKNNKYYFLLVKEYNPIFKDLNISEYSTITGGLENNDHNTTVEHEMLEEAGVNVKNEKVKIHYLGYHFGSKTSTKQWHLYGIDLTDLELDLTATYKGSGDNTIGEENISATFITENQLIKCNDMYALAIYTKLKIILNNKNMLPENFEDKIKSEKWQKQINQKVKINQLFGDNEVLDDELEEIPLLYAVKNYYFKIVELLLTKGADVDIEDENENTALYYAVKNSDFKMIELLLANNAEVNAENVSEETLLHIAAFQGDLITIYLLLKNNAEVNVKNVEKQTPLHIAAENSDFKIVELLLANNAEVNVKNVEKKTPLHIAAENSDFKIVELLLANNADVNAQNVAEETPLHIAVKNSDFKMIELLLANNADVNAQNVAEETPLHIAVKNSDFKMIELLLANNADVNAQNVAEETPLHIASENSDFKIVELLTKKRKNVEEQNYQITKFLKNDYDQSIENNNFIFNESKINSIDLQNQPSTSGNKQNSPKM